MMRPTPFRILLLASLAAGCASAPPGQLELTKEEAGALSAFLLAEARHPERPSRPILVLTPTDPSIPDSDVEPPRLSDDYPQEVKRELINEADETNRTLRALRAVNTSPIPLNGVKLPPGAMLYPRDRFEQEYSSNERFAAMVNRLGGLEPLVLSVSRPVLSEGRAAVVEHVSATWSGCGGINVFELTKSEGTWDTSLMASLVTW